LHQALAASDLLVLLSRSEGLPMALLEGMSHGLPAAVSPEVNARVAVGASGWVTPPSELGALLCRICNDPEKEWVRRREEALNMATHFEWPQVAASYLEAYNRAVDQRAG
jgi:glycosyltransferase involved in cell wall biosynthesis